ncbi:hypothetical protein VNO77_14389 [Canavalia gladiata]|uniref:Uncharacterized protein n=1 Tax=Canavalia gladiata TaxID=3824 RepID=A0AAN9QNP6_CANGL
METHPYPKPQKEHFCNDRINIRAQNPLKNRASALKGTEEKGMRVYGDVKSISIVGKLLGSRLLRTNESVETNTKPGVCLNKSAPGSPTFGIAENDLF